MSQYRIIITELAPNPAYDPEMAKRSYYNTPQFIDSTALTFTATEEQFAAIRKACVEAM